MPSDQLFAHYQILGRLGEGAHGTVYRAEDPEGRLVALKVLRPEVADDPEIGQRFRREARIAIVVVDPHVVRGYAAGEHDGKLWLTSELVVGGSLDDLRQRSGGRLPLGLALRTFADLLSGLAAIHRAGLVHRDIKPANVLLDAHGRAKVADLGLARSTAVGRTAYTAAGMIVGSPAYMAPEQIQAERDLDIRCDLYSAGALLMHCLTGELPFTAGSALDMLRQHLQQPAPRLRTRLANAPVELERLIDDLLAKDPARRPADPLVALARVQAIQAALSGAATVATDARAGAATLPADLLGAQAFPGTLADGATVFPGTIPDRSNDLYPLTLADGGAFPPTMPERGFPATLATGADVPATVAQDAGDALTVPMPHERVALARGEGVGSARMMLTLGAHRLFVYAGDHLQFGRDGVELGRNDVCLRLFPAATRADDARRISGIHLRVHAQTTGVSVEDLSSALGSELDGRRLIANTPVPVRSKARVRIAGVLELEITPLPPALFVTSDGQALSGAPAVLVRRRDNGSDHAYLLLPGTARLRADAAEGVIAADGCDLLNLAGTLWYRAGERALPLSPGAALPAGPAMFQIQAFDPRVQKDQS